MDDECNLIVQFIGHEQMDIAAYLSRLSIFSEDPVHRGNIIDWKLARQCSAFRYLGHNIPGVKVSQFFNKLKIPDGDAVLDSSSVALSSLCREPELHLFEELVAAGLDVFDEVVCQRFYLIGNIVKDYKTEYHELSHAFYHFYDDYSKQVSRVYDNIKGRPRKRLDDCLSLRGYTAELFPDEFAAYVVEGDKEVMKIVGSDLQKECDDIKAMFLQIRDKSNIVTITGKPDMKFIDTVVLNSIELKKQKAAIREREKSEKKKTRMERRRKPVGS